jgi:hypothetical protein
MRPLSIRVICASVLVSSCGGAPTAPSLFTVFELASAPTRVSVAGKSLTLATSLWRDFQPIAPADGRPLVAVLQVKTDDRSDVPRSVQCDTVWVLNGAETWSAVPREECSRADTAPVYELVARNGPKWGPGISVDVVVRLRDAEGRPFLLRAAKQVIQATF